jgi:UDPglucose 6-dehydrogenase
MTRAVAQRRRTRVGVEGLGYMGLATALAFCAKGYHVTGYDLSTRVRSAVRRGTSPFWEPGLSRLLRTSLRNGRLHVAVTPKRLVDDSEVIFLCLPTPSRRSGAIDLRAVRTGARELGRALRGARSRRVVAIKSTVVPGTTERIVEPILRRSSGSSARRLGVAACPEFLAEGSMVHDALHPERVVIGTSEAWTARVLCSLFGPFHAPIHVLTPSGAELVKYSANSFLALKVSFANEVSRMAEALGTDVDSVLGAVGQDPRIGSRFLRAGPGFGGSCFTKDLRAITARARELGSRFRSAEAALVINADQTEHAFRLVQGAAGRLKGKRIAFLGLAFKANTDDVRESRAFPILRALSAAGARVVAHDPVATARFQEVWGRPTNGRAGRVRFVRSVEGALTGADLAVLHTDWPDYARWPVRWTRRMRRPLLVDLRRAVPARVARAAGLRVIALGNGPRAGGRSS